MCILLRSRSFALIRRFRFSLITSEGLFGRALDLELRCRFRGGHVEAVDFD